MKDLEHVVNGFIFAESACSGCFQTFALGVEIVHDFIRFARLCLGHKCLIMETHVVAVLAHKRRFFCLSIHLRLQKFGM